MKQYHLNKKEIMFWANKAFKRLKLKPIPIRINKIKYPCDTGGFFFNKDDMYINIAQISSGLIVEREYVDDKLSSNSMMIFAILHEIAHYFQYHHYFKWFDKYSDYEHYSDMKDEYYAKQKIEQNADKIAMILFKELNP